MLLAAGALAPITEYVEGSEYLKDQISEVGWDLVTKDGEIYATISNLLVSPQASGTFLSLEFKEAAEQAILAKEKTFTAADESGEEITYQLQNKNQQ